MSQRNFCIIRIKRIYVNFWTNLKLLLLDEMNQCYHDVVMYFHRWLLCSSSLQHFFYHPMLARCVVASTTKPSYDNKVVLFKFHSKDDPVPYQKTKWSFLSMPLYHDHSTWSCAHFVYLSLHIFSHHPCSISCKIIPLYSRSFGPHVNTWSLT